MLRWERNTRMVDSEFCASVQLAFIAYQASIRTFLGTRQMPLGLTGYRQGVQSLGYRRANSGRQHEYIERAR